MGKLIVGEEPSVEKKYRSFWVYDEDLDRGALSRRSIAEQGRERAGVPQEATMTMEADLPRGAVQFRWEWWEVTF